MVFEINNLGSIARRAPAAAWELGHSTAQCCAGGCEKKGVMSFMWGTALALTSAFLQDVSCMEWSVLAASEQGKPTAIPCCAVLCCAVPCNAVQLSEGAAQKPGLGSSSACSTAKNCAWKRLVHTSPPLLLERSGGLLSTKTIFQTV